MLLALALVLWAFGVLVGYLLWRWTRRARRSGSRLQPAPQPKEGRSGVGQSRLGANGTDATRAGADRSGPAGDEWEPPVEVASAAAIEGSAGTLAAPSTSAAPHPICILELLEPPSETESTAAIREESAEGACRLLDAAREAAERLQARAAFIDALSGSPDNPRELTDVVLSDPTLTGQLLRAVNSPFYGLRHPIPTAHRAVHYLGHLEVRNLIWKICFSDAFWSTPSPEEEAALEEFWRHSFRASRLAHYAARALKLHDIGRLVSWRVRPERLGCGIGSATTPETLIEEREALGMTHAALGAEIAVFWRLPEWVCDAIRRHHDPMQSRPEAGLSALGPGLVYLADTLTHCAVVSAGSDPYRIPGPMDGWWKAIGIHHDPNGFCLDLLRSSARELTAAAPATPQCSSKCA
jgi:hypothetical protein